MEILGKSLGNLGEILGKSWGNLGEILEKSWGNLVEILGKSWGNLGKILGKSALFTQFTAVIFLCSAQLLMQNSHSLLRSS